MIYFNYPIKEIGDIYMKKILILLIFIFCFIPSCFATNWYLLDEADNGNKWYADIDSMQRTPQYATTWLKDMFPNKEFVLYKVIFNRSNRTYALTSIILYDANGKVKGIDTYNHYDWQPIPPDTKLEKIFQAFW